MMLKRLDVSFSSLVNSNDFIDFDASFKDNSTMIILWNLRKNQNSNDFFDICAFVKAFWIVSGSDTDIHQRSDNNRYDIQTIPAWPKVNENTFQKRNVLFN